jgi:hypothetical protein
MFRNRHPIASSASAKCATISAIDHFSGAGRRINSSGATIAQMPIELRWRGLLNTDGLLIAEIA